MEQQIMYIFNIFHVYFSFFLFNSTVFLLDGRGHSNVKHFTVIVVVQSLSGVWLVATPWTAAHRLPCPSLSLGVCSNSSPLSQWCHSISSNRLIFSCPLLLLPSIFHSIRVFPMSQFFSSSGQSTGASASAISPSNEYSGLISFRIDWFDLLAVRGTFKSLLQHHNSKVSILRHSAFFTVQLTSVHDYWKNHSFD